MVRLAIWQGNFSDVTPLLALAKSTLTIRVASNSTELEIIQVDGSIDPVSFGGIVELRDDQLKPLKTTIGNLARLIAERNDTLALTFTKRARPTGP